MAFVARMRSCLLFFAITVGVLMFAPGMPPYDVEFGGVALPSSVPFEGGLAPNNRLDAAEKITVAVDGSTLGYIKGAEAFAFRDGYLYTGIIGGDIIRLDMNKDVLKGEWQTVAKATGDHCLGEYDEAGCGRPLGMAFDRWGFLLVCDTYRGLLRVDVNTGRTQVLIPPTQLIEGKRNAITNSIAISGGDGNVVYLTSSSSHFGLEDGLFEILSRGSGRLLRHDMAANETRVLVDGVSFANGVALSPDEDFLVFGESGGNRVWKYHLASGKREVFAELPGVADNITPNGKGGFFVGVVTVNPRVAFRIKTIGPLARGLVRLMMLSQMLVDYLHSIVPNETLRLLAHHIGHLEISSKYLSPKYGLVVELDKKGKVSQSWHSPTGTTMSICEAFLHSDGFMYLGSPFNSYIARVPYN